MEELHKLKNKFIELPDALPGMMKKVFEGIKPVVEDLNTEQLDRGQRIDGSMLPNYSPVSVNKFGKRPGPMNMHNHGDYWAGITLEVYDDGIELVGRDPKSEMLELRYGGLIGLQDQSKDKIEKDYLQDGIEEELRNDYFPK